MIDSPRGGYAVEMWLSEDYAGGLQEAVERELAAALESASGRGRTALTVEVHEGVARLAGRVSSWAEKVRARRAVMRVPGVAEVDDGAVAVTPDPAEDRSDAELVHMVGSALSWDSRVPRRRVRVSVTEGSVMLDGFVDHDDEREAAEETVARLVGVREVVNDIVVPPRPRPAHALTRLQEALSAALGREAKHLRVALSDSGVELTGRLSTLALRVEAERTVRRMLGDVPLTVQVH